ncbi:MAG: hypothetical protein ABIJ09_09875, partial [Pseudomonadota bacterium]
MTAVLGAMLILVSQCGPALEYLDRACAPDAVACAGDIRAAIQTLVDDEVQLPIGVRQDLAALPDDATWAARVRATCQGLVLHHARCDLAVGELVARALADPRLRREHAGSNPLQVWLRALSTWLSQVLGLRETRAMAAAVRIGFLGVLVGVLLVLLLRLARRPAPGDRARARTPSAAALRGSDVDVRAQLLQVPDSLSRLRQGVELLAESLVQADTVRDARTRTGDEIARHPALKQVPPALQVQLRAALELYGRGVFARQPVTE